MGYTPSHLGHVNIYVRNAEASRQWYEDVLGLHTYDFLAGRAAFMTANLDESHEIALMEIGADIEQNSTPLQRTGPLTVSTEVCTDIAILSAFPGMEPTALGALVEAGKRMVMIRGFGEGNLPQAGWPKAIRSATNAGVHILVGSQCRAGASRPGRYAGSTAALTAGALFIGDMTGEAAVVKSMCLLGRGLDGEAFRSALLSPMAGEITPGSAARL
jgi:L-asparaginase/Glu-tRNA(Gln) amidotransferase subunit D